MFNQSKKLLMMTGAMLSLSNAYAGNINLDANATKELRLSIYNQNLALVSDVRKADLDKGGNNIAFEAVSEQIKPETALLQGKGLRVIEQNYEYDLLNYENILDQLVGKEVKTVITNQETGKNFFDKAEVVNSNNGMPLLKFSYGVESNFPGRIVFEKVPENLKVKPTLEVKVESAEKGDKDLTLNYLTNGMSWNADYVAEITGEDSLNWQGWVTIVNNSGADYKNAKVDLVAGSINQAPQNLLRARPMMAMKSASFAMDTAESAPAMGMNAENAAEYYRYTLPFETDIMNKQSKQVSLMEIKNVKFRQIYKLSSPLYIAFNSYSDEFERVHPSTVYKFENIKGNNLGLPLPSGIVRFYDKDNTLFVGEGSINQIAEGEKFELAVGKSFDLYASGKITEVKKLSDKSFEAEVEVKFSNAKKNEATIEFEQNFQGSIEVVKESLKSSKDKAKTLKWDISVPAKGNAVLTYTVRVVRN